MNSFRHMAWALVFLAWFTPKTALSDESCPNVDEEAYVLYVYGDSDAKILLDQKCESSDGKSLLEQIIEGRAECRCYDKKFSEVVSRLKETPGPIPVTTRKMAGVSAGITCRTALQRCEETCQTAATSPSAPKACATMTTAGITIY